jgi:hypothetical protein
MNESVKAICCHGSGVFNEDPHTISGNHGHKPQCCHVSRVLFNVLMAHREGKNFPYFIKNKVTHIEQSCVSYNVYRCFIST